MGAEEWDDVYGPPETDPIPPGSEGEPPIDPGPPPVQPYGVLDPVVQEEVR